MFKMISSAAGATGGVLSADSVRNASTTAGDAQKAAISQMIAKLDAVGMPPDQSAKLILDQYRQAGILTPDLMNQVQQQTSQFAQLKTNQPTLDVQMQALQRMSQLGQAGLTPDERSQQRLLQQQNQQANNANQQSIIQNMQARGIQGGGAEIASRLGASQNAANQGSSAADQVSSMAQQRALQAIAQSGGMAGRINQQQFGQQATIAGAQDQMNRFNVQNQMAINQQNVNAANQAQAANLANSQQISNANVGATNQEQYDQLARQRQLWQEKMREHMLTLFSNMDRHLLHNHMVKIWPVLALFLMDLVHCLRMLVKWDKIKIQRNKTRIKILINNMRVSLVIVAPPIVVAV
jgi:hypothetical protein